MQSQWLEAVGSGSDLSMSCHPDTWRGWHETCKLGQKVGLALRYQLRGFRSQEVKQRQMWIPSARRLAPDRQAASKWGREAVD